MASTITKTTPSVAAVEGTGPSRVLVLPGWALDANVWLATRAKLNVEQFTFAYVDFPGYGVAREEPLAEGIDGMAAVAIAAADSLGWDTFGILGHSMGGETALRVATLVPDRVTNIVAVTPVSPAGTPLDSDTYASFNAAWADPGAAIKGALSPQMSDSDLTNLVARNRASMSQATWEKYLHNWTSSPSFIDEVGNYSGRVTVLWGETDPFVTPAYLDETLSALRNATLIEIPSAGHYPMIENPAALAEIIENEF
ncbi:alpha/beta hydrolase [Leifsonia sp. NPDC077715]|uniref:alpha/beta fold hydrolase n=1 Tax=Leifsonia sp. NPDC077715 TaxID=3155539 RepID=UPI0034405384